MLAPLHLPPATVRALERHETEAHAIGGREIVDLPGALALFDPQDADPFWNRMVRVRWPDGHSAFDRRLGEAIVLFATRGRRPHVWPTVTGDEPPDLVARLIANGFEDAGRGILMARPLRREIEVVTSGADTSLEVIRAGREGVAGVMRDVAEVLAAAFPRHGERDDALDIRGADEIAAAAGAAHRDLVRVLRDPRVAFVLARVDGVLAAVAKVTGGSGLAYLSSIATRPSLRGRGLGGLVTLAALREGAAAGAALAYLGVFEGNVRAQRLYARLGFGIVGAPVPDLLLVG